MTRKDYNNLAQCMANVRPTNPDNMRGPPTVEARGMWAQWWACCDALADCLSFGNTRFDRARFMAACETWPHAIAVCK